MGFWVPDSRYEMPELFEPGRKPNGPVVIDRDHPFAPNEFFAICDIDLGFDLVTGRKMALTTTSDGLSATTADGETVWRNGADDRGFVLNKPIDVLNGTPWVIHYKAKASSTAASTEGMILGRNPSSTGSYLWHRENNVLSFLPSGASSVAFNTGFDADALDTHSLVCDGSTILGYLNGIPTGDSYTGTTRLNVRGFIDGFNVENYAFNGDVHYMYIQSGRNWSDGDVLSLHNNVCQFLIPA